MSARLTINVELNHKPRRDGTYNILIRVSKERKCRRVATELNVRKGDFNKRAKNGFWVRASEPRNEAFNQTLYNRLTQYNTKYSEILDAGKQPSLEEFITLITTNHTASFVDFYKQEIERYAKIGKYRTSEKHQYILNKLKKYLKKKMNREDLNFDELNVPFLTKYETYLKHDLGNHQNTYFTDLKNIRTIFYNAVQQDVAEQHTNPFFKFKLKQTETVKDKLTLTEIKNIEGLKLVEGKAIWHARNYFLFSYYCMGIRWGDVCTLKWSNITNDNRLRYIMSKNNKLVDSELPIQALEILKYYKKSDVKDKDYIFPLLKNWKDYSDQGALLKSISSKNSVINRQLKDIAGLAKIRINLTFHISRHSFAYNFYLENKDVNAVQTALHHSSLNETQKYLKALGATELDSQLRQLYNR
jgi:integrase